MAGSVLDSSDLGCDALWFNWIHKRRTAVGYRYWRFMPFMPTLNINTYCLQMQYHLRDSGQWVFECFPHRAVKQRSKSKSSGCELVRIVQTVAEPFSSERNNETFYWSHSRIMTGSRFVITVQEHKCLCNIYTDKIQFALHHIGFICLSEKPYTVLKEILNIDQVLRCAISYLS